MASNYNIHPQLESLATPVDQLTPDPRNAKAHPRRNIEALKRSFQRYGCRKNLVGQRTPDGIIVRAGNAGLQAAKELGWTHVPIVVHEEPDQSAIEYAVADNRIPELGEWEDDILAEYLEEMSALGVLEDVGFDQAEVDDLVRQVRAEEERLRRGFTPPAKPKIQDPDTAALKEPHVAFEDLGVVPDPERREERSLERRGRCPDCSREGRLEDFEIP